jgi:hypothetical protein
MAEDEGADRPCEKCDAECRDSSQRLRVRRATRKEELAEHGSCRALNVEVIKLDRGADQAVTMIRVVLRAVPGEPVGIGMDTIRCLSTPRLK